MAGIAKQSIVLIGMAGVGKSTIGLALSRILKLDFIDLDVYIHQRQGKTVQQVIDESGDEALVQIEKEMMREIDLNNKVVAPGGSLIYSADLMELLRPISTVVNLEDTFETISRRIGDSAGRGIVGSKEKSLREIYEERIPLYRRYADITVNCNGKTVNKVIDEIRANLYTCQAGCEKERSQKTRESRK